MWEYNNPEIPDTLIHKELINNESEKNYQSDLNPPQLNAVLSEGPVLVIAGAGTGKTRVLVHRVGYLIQKGVVPRRILLLTFTKKAAVEMMDRVSVLLKNNTGRLVSGGTFHAFANNILRQYANLIGIPVNFTILDNPDSEDVIDKIRTDCGLHQQVKLFPKKGRIFEIISASRNKQVSIRYIVEDQFTGLKGIIPELEEISELYRKYKIENRLFDFDDLVEILVNTMRHDTRFQKLISGKYQYIMVDEFQDTNKMQMDLVKLIAPEGDNVMAVGDDMQSIYSFRGACYENIIQFPTLFPNCKIITLEQNYRSQQAILNFTNEIMAGALTGYEKKLWSDKTTGEKPVVAKFLEASDEAEFVVGEIHRFLETNVPANQIAVLVRSSRNSVHIQLELEKRGIPYVVVGGVKFTERKHIKDIVAYLRIAFNMKDRVAWHRVLKLLPGVGPSTAEKILLFLEDGNILESLPGTRYNDKVRGLGKVINEISDETIPIPGRIEKIKQHYYPILESTDPEADIKKVDIEFLQKISADYETLENFLTDFALNPPSKRMAKRIDPLIDETEERPVTISTIHSAKGLEWHTVFVPHALEGIIPNNKAITEEDIEEERRMFYVACTRAKENLYITYPSFLPGYNAYFHQPSRFLEEINNSNYLYISKLI